MTPDSVTRRARRRDVSKSGILKAVDPRRQRRVNSNSIIGEHVPVVSSPATSLPELLKEAEVGLVQTPGSLCFETPSPARRTTPSFIPEAQLSATPHKLAGPGEWTRDDWKLLDACFTEERLELSRRLGLGDDVLASVDHIGINDVVARFIQTLGVFQADHASASGWSM